MLHYFANLLRGGLDVSAVAGLCFTATLLHAGAQLEIVSPENGLRVMAGSELKVTIKASAGSFQTISIEGDGPFLLSTPVSQPPYEYSYVISPVTPSGRYRFHAVGVHAAGESLQSDPVEVDVEQPEIPKRIEAQGQSVNIAEHETAALQIWGILADGSKVDLTRSSQMAYTSDRPAVATVDSEGNVSAVKAGKAKVTAKYGDKVIAIQVGITK